jgi:site-specific DNA-methyltransferase (adenine-specific)
MTGWLSECRRLARPDGALLLFSDWRQVPLISDAVQAAGWVWRGQVVWDKTARARPVRGSYRHQAEFVLFATKGPWTPPTGGTFPGVFVHAPAGKNHLTAKPVRLARDLLGILAPGSDVLDPFMGGGSILKGAADAGHRVLGIELQEESFGAAGRLLGVPTGRQERGSHSARAVPRAVSGMGVPYEYAIKSKN